MNRDETTVAQEIGTAARHDREGASGRRRARHEVAVVQAEIRRMQLRSARGRQPAAAAGSGETASR